MSTMLFTIEHSLIVHLAVTKHDKFKTSQLIVMQAKVKWMLTKFDTV